MTVFAVCQNLVLAHRFLCLCRVKARRPEADAPRPSWSVDIPIDGEMCGEKDIATPRRRWCEYCSSPHHTQHRRCDVSTTTTSCRGRNSDCHQKGRDVRSCIRS